MDGQNLAFTSNPRRHLETNALVCYGNKGAAQKADINRLNGNTLPVTQEFPADVEFDFVRNRGGYIDVTMLGVVGAYRASGRRGRPILGNYIPYLGQQNRNPSKDNFGRINLSRVTTNYVVTFSFTGCNFVVTREGGDAYVYHQPLSEAVTRANPFNGITIINAGIGPDYTQADVVGGYGCLVRDIAVAGRWIVYIQTPIGVKMTAARLTATTINI